MQVGSSLLQCTGDTPGDLHCKSATYFACRWAALSTSNLSANIGATDADQFSHRSMGREARPGHSEGPTSDDVWLEIESSSVSSGAGGGKGGGVGMLGEGPRVPKDPE